MHLHHLTSAELQRADTIARLNVDALSVEDAALLLSCTTRTVYRLLAIYRLQGAAGFTSGKRGKPSNNRYPAALRLQVNDLIARHYEDYGPTLISERLSARHGILISRETVRCWMIASGAWPGRKAHRNRIHSPRARKAHVGRLVLIDGTTHDWFEGRGPICCLIVFIDDAGSEIMHLHMATAETTFAYMTTALAYFFSRGKPISLYSDKHSVLYVSGLPPGEIRLTQFGRALVELGVALLHSNTPQARGRVERSHATHQDRLVKRFREEGISTIAEANAFLPIYMAEHNEMFAKVPREVEDLHRPISEVDNVDRALSIRVERHVSPALVVQFENDTYILENTPAARDQIGKRVIVERHLDDRLTMRDGDTVLSFTRYKASSRRSSVSLNTASFDAVQSRPARFVRPTR